MKYSDKIQAAYKAQAADGPSTSNNDSGATHPENWVTSLQSGKSVEEIRQEASILADIVKNWQEECLKAYDLFKILEANGGKYFEMFSPILLKGLSKNKLTMIATICTRMAKSASIQ